MTRCPQCDCEICECDAEQHNSYISTTGYIGGATEYESKEDA